MVLGGVVHAEAVEPTAGYPAVQQAFLREDFQQVAELAQTFILEHPHVSEVPRVWLWLSLSLDRLERSDEALRELGRLKSRLNSKDPLWPELLFWEGDISRRAFQMNRGKAAFQQLLQRYPGSMWSGQAELGLGLVLLQQEECPDAIEHFRKVASGKPDAPIALDAQLFEGLCQVKLQQFAEAAKVFEPLLGRLQARPGESDGRSGDPGSIAQASFYLGESLSGLLRFEEAAAAYQSAIRAAPSSSWAHLSLFGIGWAHYKSRRCEESARAFERFLAQPELDHRTEALFALGSCLLQLGREREALSRFEQIVSNDPDHPLALDSGLIIVSAYRRQDRLVLAKELLHAMLRRRLDDASRARIQLELGALALEQNNPAQARTIFDLATKSAEPSIRQMALNGMGDVHMFFGDLAAARQAYEQAMQIAAETPLAAYAAYQVGRIHLQLGRPGEAKAVFQQLAAQPDEAVSGDATLALALAYLQSREVDMARTTLDALRGAKSGSVIAARAAYYLAVVALDAGDSATARRLCDEALSKAPGTEEAVEAQLLLVDLEASQTSVAEALTRLKRTYAASTLPSRHRAKLAKHLGALARSESRYPEAIEWYQEAARQLPAISGEAAYRIASCYEEARDFELAIHWYGQITQLPWRVRGQLATAKLLERDEREQDAEAIYRALAAEALPEAKVAQERLSALQRRSLTVKESRW